MEQRLAETERSINVNDIDDDQRESSVHERFMRKALTMVRYTLASDGH